MNNITTKQYIFIMCLTFSEYRQIISEWSTIYKQCESKKMIDNKFKTHENNAHTQNQPINFNQLPFIKSTDNKLSFTNTEFIKLEHQSLINFNNYSCVG